MLLYIQRYQIGTCVKIAIAALDNILNTVLILCFSL